MVSSTTITNDDGTYLVVGLPLRDYKISLKADGHQDRTNLDAKVEKAEMNYFSTYLLKLP